MASLSAPVMVHHPSQVKRQDGPSLIKSNKWKSLNSAFLSEHAIYQNMQFPGSKKTDAHYFCRSNATQFANSGIMSGGHHYVRDPLTGTWFKHKEEKQRELHHTKSDLCYRYTESRHEKGETNKTFSIWAAPCGGQFWKEPARKPHKPTAFGFTDGPVQRARPVDPKDMPNPLSPLTRTSSAPNFLPQTMSKKALTKSSMSASTTASSLR